MLVLAGFASPAQAQSRESATHLRALLSTDGFAVRDLPALDGAASFRLPQRGDLLRGPVDSGDFLDDHLMPRLSRKLDHLAARHPSIGANDSLIDHPMFDELRDRVEDRSISGVRNAVRDYLLQTSVFSGLSRLYESGRDKAPRAGGESLRLSMGIAHTAPRLELRHQVGSTITRFGVGLRGHVNLEFSTSRMSRTRVSLEYDPGDHQYVIACRFGL
jgi:hypothetical protein